MAGPASALYLLDIKGHVLVWRDYRGDVSAVRAERFFTKLIEKEGDPGSQYPVAYNNGVTYLFMQHSNGYPMTASRQNCNAASLLAFFSFCTARLIGMLECKLGLNDRVLLETQGRSSKGKPLIWMTSSFISVCVWHDLKMIGQ